MMMQRRPGRRCDAAGGVKVSRALTLATGLLPLLLACEDPAERPVRVINLVRDTPETAAAVDAGSQDAQLDLAVDGFDMGEVSLNGADDQPIEPGTVVPMLDQSKVRGRGQLARRDIERALQPVLVPLAICYAKEPTAPARGGMTVIIKVLTGGTVGYVKQRASTLGSTIDACAINALRELRFARPKGGIAYLTLPILFKR